MGHDTQLWRDKEQIEGGGGSGLPTYAISCFDLTKGMCNEKKQHDLSLLVGSGGRQTLYALGRLGKYDLTNGTRGESISDRLIVCYQGG
jgi:hypothetical protein